MPNLITEDQIEQALLARLTAQPGWSALNCYTADPEQLADGSGRADKRDVILRDRLREAARRLNPELPEPVLDEALDHLFDRRQAMTPVIANREVYDLLRNGFPVEFDDAQGRTRRERLQVIDFHDAATERFPRRLAALDQGRARLSPAGRAALRQRPAAGVHRTEKLQRRTARSLSTTTSPTTSARFRSFS